MLAIDWVFSNLIKKRFLGLCFLNFLGFESGIEGLFSGNLFNFIFRMLFELIFL